MFAADPIKRQEFLGNLKQALDVNRHPSKVSKLMSNLIVKEINNRNLVLSPGYLYRENMKYFEIQNLLPAVSILVELLSLPIANVPVEGYYTENEDSYLILLKTMSSEILGYGKNRVFFQSGLIHSTTR